MSADGSITLKWADSEYIFRLALGQLRELEAKRNAGFAQIFNRIQSENWFVDDLREIIRLGLIGGGLPPLAALNMVENYVDARPKTESILPATLIIMTAMVGDLDDIVGKEAAENLLSDSGSPQSMATEPL